MKFEERIKKYSELSRSKDDNKQIVGLIIKGNYIASNYIRILSPFSNFSNTNYVPYLIDRPDFNAFKKDLVNDNVFLDIVIVQRDALEADFAELLVQKCKLFGIKLIFEIDDDLINMDKSSPIYNDFLPRIKVMEFLAENSDCITVSTDILRERMLIYNDNVITIPNALVDYWDIKKDVAFKDNSNSIKIGYMGTITHTKDLKIIERVIKNIQTKRPDKNIIFEVVEGTTDEIEGINIIRIPSNDQYYPNFVYWLQNNIDWDIAIAPLIEDDPINLSKSELKYLEYTALNIPCVYSAVGPYDYAIVHEKNGMLVKDNNVYEWEHCLTKLIDDAILRREIVLNAWEDIENNYLIDNMVTNWINVLNLNNRNKSGLLYRKINDYFDESSSISFNDFLIRDHISIVSESNLFDETYYLTEYPDVKLCDLSAINHYLVFGYGENCNPNKNFDKRAFNNLYLIHDFNLHPFVYYCLYNDCPPYFINSIHDNHELNEEIIRKEDIFDVDFYLYQQPDVKKAGVDPIYHFAKYGYKEKNRNPNPHFSCNYYIKNYLGDTRIWNPLTHYILIGKEKGFKINPWDIPNNFYSINVISSILNNLSKKVSIFIPIFNYSTKVMDCLESIIKNTFGNYELIIFINDTLLDKYNNFDFLNEEDINFKILSREDSNYITLIQEYFQSFNNDIVFLNSYSEVTYNWLSRLIAKAYSSEDIDVVSPISNFIGNLSSFSDSLENNDFLYTANGMDTFLRKSSNHDNIYSQVGDGFCIYIKDRVKNKIQLNQQLVYNLDNACCYLYLLDNVCHIFDDSIYIYHDPSFFEDNAQILKSHLNSFAAELKVNRFLKSPFSTTLKNKLKCYLQDINQVTLSNRILYVLDEKNYHYFLDFIGYYTKKYYDCYFLTCSNKEFKLWKDANLLKKWSLSINLEDSLKSELFKEMYFNILYLLNINIVHIINFNHNSFDLFDISNSLNIKVILNCTDDFFIHPLQKTRCLHCCGEEQCGYGDLNEYCKNIRNEFEDILNDNVSIIDESLNEIYDFDLDDENSLILNYNYCNFNSKIIDLFDNSKSKSLSLLIVGKLSSEEFNIIKNLKEQNNYKLLDLHFMGNFSNDINQIGINHGLLDINSFQNAISEINPDFVVIFNEFSEMYDVIYYSNKNKNIVLINSNNLNNLSAKFDNCISFSIPQNMIYYEDILKLKYSNYYYNILSNLFYKDEQLKNHSLYLTRWFGKLYSEYGDNNPKEIIPMVSEQPSGGENESRYNFKAFLNDNYGEIVNTQFNKSEYDSLNFNTFLNKSYVYPLKNRPFTGEDYENFAIMESITKYLENKSYQCKDKPLVSVIMPVYNREDLIKTAINSILNQTYVNFELIVVDDGSTDKTVDIIRSISDNRIKLIVSDENKGSSGARNLGLEMISGDYILYLDSDNEWEPNYIDVVMGAFLELPDADAVYVGQLLYKDINDDPFAIRFGSFNKSLLMNGNYIDLNCLSYKREVHEKVGGFDETLNRLVDWDLIFRISNYFKVYSVPVLISKYYFGAAKNRISDFSVKNHEKDKLLKNLFRNVHINNFMIKKPNYKLNKVVNIVIYNISSLMSLQECINHIFSLKLDKIEITIIDNRNDENVTEYIDTLKAKGNVNVIIDEQNNGGIITILQDIVRLPEFSGDLLLLDANAILLNGALEFMQEYAYNLPDCGIVIPQHLIPDEMNQEEHSVPYTNPDIKCDLTPTYYPNNFINMPIFNDGDFIELKLPPLFCTYLKHNAIMDIYNIDFDVSDYSSTEFLSYYIRDIQHLKIYYASNAIVYHNFNKQNKWGV